MKVTTIGWEDDKNSGRAAFMVRLDRDVYELELLDGETVKRRAKATRNQALIWASLWCDTGRDETRQ